MSFVLKTKRISRTGVARLLLVAFTLYLCLTWRRRIKSLDVDNGAVHLKSDFVGEFKKKSATGTMKKSYVGCYENATTELPKTVYATGDAPRFWIPVGLEHTGHHLWNHGILEALEKKKVTRVADDGVSIRFAYSRQVAEQKIGWECGLDERPLQRYDDATMQDIYKLMFEYEKSQSRPAHAATIGFCSYPCHRWKKPGEGMNPDIVSVAKAAERAGADIRVLVLTRPVHRIVKEFTTDEGRVYVNACWELVSQLEAIDPKFYACFPYNGYGELVKNQAALKSVSEFLSGNSDQLVEPLADAIREAYQPTQSSSKFPPASWLVVDKDVRLELESCARRLEEVACDKIWNLGSAS